MNGFINLLGKGLALIVGLLAITGGGGCVSAYGWSEVSLIGGLVMAFGAAIIWLTFKPAQKLDVDSDRST
ncbi:hypothetical protein SDC9_132999 [bioreactor metagenome]|uniref:Uncharacterized protein n=1 Tax=bioreactor metagenome TaxID=1076179 RepID=A0A645D931_9ZZZZ